MSVATLESLDILQHDDMAYAESHSLLVPEDDLSLYSPYGGARSLRTVHTLRSKTSQRSHNSNQSQRSKSSLKSSLSSSFMMESPMINANSRLLKPTLSFYIATHTDKDKDKEKEGDIWFSPRNAKILEIGRNATEHKFDHVQSKLYDTTQSFENNTFVHAAPVAIAPTASITPINNVVKAINPDSRILQPTTSFTFKVDNDHVLSMLEAEKLTEAETVTEARLRSLRSGPDVPSRLHATTAAVVNSKWKSKAQLEFEDAKRLKEEKAKLYNLGSGPKVSKPSEHLLIPTAAMKNSKFRRSDDEDRSPGPTDNYNDLDDGQSVATHSTALTTHTSHSRKIRETSSSLLRPTAAMRNAQYRPPEVRSKSVSSAGTGAAVCPVVLREHLTKPTVGLELARYKKTSPDVDPRELGWRSYGGRSGITDSTVGDRPDSAIASGSASSGGASSPIPSVKKVKATSDRLYVPNDHQRWKGHAVETVSEVNLWKIRPISADDHLLKPKEAPVSFELDTASVGNERKKVGKPSEHLLALTVANERSKYIKPEDRVIEEEEDLSDAPQGPTMKVKETSSRVLSLTAAYENHRRPSPEPPKELPKQVSSTEHFLTPTMSFTLSTTKKRVMFTINEDGIPTLTDDAVSVATPKLPPPVSPNARFLSPTASFKNKTQRNVGDFWIDAVSSSGGSVYGGSVYGGSVSGRSVSPSVSTLSSISTSTTLSSVSVKHLVKVFSVRNVNSS